MNAETPIGWARRWYIDGEKPVKTKNAEGRWVWGKFILLPVTATKLASDDVPLYARPTDLTK